MQHDPAMGKLDYERIENDFYPTPAWCTQGLIDVATPNLLRSEETFWEPAAGKGAIMDVLAGNEIKVVGSDLICYDPTLPIVTGVDFLAQTRMPIGVDSIITNPPYGKLAEQFVRHAIKLAAPQNGRVYMLLRNEFDSAKGRSDLFDMNTYFAAKMPLTSRPRWIENSTGSPRHNYAWFVWDTSRRLYNPTLRYIHKT